MCGFLLICFTVCSYRGGWGSVDARNSPIASSGILAADRQVANYWLGSFDADWTITSKIQHVFWSWGKERKPLGAGDKRYACR